MKKIILLGIFLVLLSCSVLADGGFFSDYNLHMYIPDQKAAITWDGETETMIIASSARSDSLSNIAWVVPIQSSIKPEISESNISIFEDLVDYFGRINYGGKSFDAGEGVTAAGGVQVIEQKEIDVYDITILKATDSQELLDWLNNNDYKVPQNTKSVLDKYVSKGDMYFIANKIDLRNKYQDEIDLIKDLQENSELEGTYFSEYEVEDAVEVIQRTSQNTEYSWTNDVDQLYFALSYIYEYHDFFNESAFLSFPEYKRIFYSLDNDFINEFIDENEKFVKNFRYNDNPKKLGTQYWTWLSNSWDNKGSNRLIDEEPGIYCLFKYRDVGTGTPAQYSLIYSDLDITEYAVNIGNCDRFSEEQKQDLRDNLEEFYENYNKYDPLIEEKYEKANQIINNSNLDKSKINEILQTISELRIGIATPLKFEFKPIIPYYPLEISSINKGWTHIEVYLFTKNKIEDQNNITGIDKIMTIDNDLREKLEEHIDLGDSKYVTRFIFDGDLSELTADAEYTNRSVEKQDEPVIEPVQEEKFDIFTVFWEWLKSWFI